MNTLRGFTPHGLGSPLPFHLPSAKKLTSYFAWFGDQGQFGGGVNQIMMMFETRQKKQSISSEIFS